MFERMVVMFGVLVFALAMAGCNGESGNGFEGRWSQTKESVKSSSAPTYTIDIKRDSEIFHIDLEINSHDFISGGRQIKHKKLEGKAESDSVISMMGGLRTMRLQDGHLFFEGSEYVKIH